jgi:hypothetical protein
MQQSTYFPELAQASGDFTNTIDDLDVLYDASNLGHRSGDTDRVYRLWTPMPARCSATFRRSGRDDPQLEIVPT